MRISKHAGWNEKGQEIGKSPTIELSAVDVNASADLMHDSGLLHAESLA